MQPSSTHLPHASRLAHHLRRAVAGSAVLAAGLLGVGVTAAAASPSLIPTAFIGRFTCPGGVSGTFWVNSGNAGSSAGSPTTWQVSHFTLSNGETGVSVPTMVDLVAIGDVATKPSSAPGAVTCTVYTMDWIPLGTATGIVHPNGSSVAG
jgi:hypothetical protein